MVSIMPGIDIAEPERTETRSGSDPLPKVLDVDISSLAISFFTEAIRPFGSWS